MSDEQRKADAVARLLAQAAFHCDDTGRLCAECAQPWPCLTSQLAAALAVREQEIAELRAEVEKEAGGPTMSNERVDVPALLERAASLARGAATPHRNAAAPTLAHEAVAGVYDTDAAVLRALAADVRAWQLSEELCLSDPANVDEWAFQAMLASKMVLRRLRGEGGQR